MIITVKEEIAVFLKQIDEPKTQLVSNVGKLTFCERRRMLPTLCSIFSPVIYLYFFLPGKDQILLLK